jgi:hypothetical protein
MAAPNFFGFDATDAKIQVPSASLACTFTDSGDLVTKSAHGLSNGDVVVFQTIVTTTGLSAFVRYYVISSTTNTFQISATYGGSAVVLTSDGSGTYKSILEYDLKFVNKVTFNAQKKSFTYEGDGQSRERSKVTGFTLAIAADCISQSVREAIYAKTPVTTSLDDAHTRGVWEGDSVETAGVSCGIWAEGSATAQDSSSGAESQATLRRWWPLGTLTYDGPAEMTTSDKMGLDQYTFVASKTSVDVAAGALPGVPSGGAYQLLSQI